ncbi:MAG: N-acetyltransferase [Planctomycetaceae bacterium]|nr:N-acetyltransferase [Planctomycetaceae bacterium]
MRDLQIRTETTEDRAAVYKLNVMAFGGPAEANLVEALRDGGFVRLSLVAEVQGEIVGHLLFSRLPIITAGGVVEALSLAPLAVHPEWQRRGIGSRLMERGLLLCREAGHRIVLVLGHPEYYPRFGFSASLAAPLTSPFGGGDAWMALELVPGALSGVVGNVEYSPPFTEL